MPDPASPKTTIPSPIGKISDAEWQTRVNLAAAFRLSCHFGWNTGISNHITARVPEEKEHFLMNPLGLGWHEITASSLVKVDYEGNVLGEIDAKLAPAGLNFHSAIHAARPQVNCSFHIHPKAGVVIAATKRGLMIVDQSACELYDQVAYHEFEGIATKKDEAARIIADLGEKRVMIMWNHGLLTVGRTVGEAFVYMKRLITACELQVTLMATGAEIREIPEKIIRFTVSQMRKRQGDAPAGRLEWEMYLRLAEKLDPSFLT